MGEALTQLPPEYDPAEYRVNANGAIVSRATGRIVKGPPGGGKYGISPARSSELRSLWRSQKIRDQLRGIVLGAGMEPSDIDDDLIRQAGTAAEAYYAHLGQTFLGSKNLRGMGETVTRLLGLDDKDTEAGNNAGETVRALTELLHAVQDVVAQQAQPDIIDGVAIDNNYYRKHTDDVHIDSGQDSAGGAGGGADASGENG